MSFLLAMGIVGGMAGYAYWSESPLLGVAAESGASATEGESAPVASRAIAASSSPSAALPGMSPAAGFATILANQSGALTVRLLENNPRIIVFDYPDLPAQARALNRIAALVEKADVPRDRVLSEAELASYIEATGGDAATFFYGHDYMSSDLARFFSLAKSQATALRPEEEVLLDLLLANGFLEAASDGAYQRPAEEKALVSVVQVQGDDPATAEADAVDPLLRATILRHELSHGEFFTNRPYRDYCVRFWRDHLSTDERLIFRVFLNKAGYDPSNETIMVNEMQAFLMNTPDGRAFSAALLDIDPANLEALRRRFLAGSPPSAMFGPGHPIAGPLLATSGQ